MPLSCVTFVGHCAEDVASLSNFIVGDGLEQELIFAVVNDICLCLETLR